MTFSESLNLSLYFGFILFAGFLQFFEIPKRLYNNPPAFDLSALKRLKGPNMILMVADANNYRLIAVTDFFFGYIFRALLPSKGVIPSSLKMVSPR